MSFFDATGVGVFARPRLLTSIAVAVAIYLLLPSVLSSVVRAISAWDAGVCCYLALAFRMFAKSDLARIRQRAAQQDENAWIFLLLTSAAALFSLLAIGYLLHGAKELAPAVLAAHLALAGTAIVCSWALVHTMFALHYAHGYYQREKIGAGLQFPNEKTPDYWDFCYFSFVVGMTCQVSDVEIADRSLRRLALAHGVLSFFFNTIILALSINIAAGLL